MKPEDIETLSFKIIDQEAGSHEFTREEWCIVRRMIHTSADFEYMDTICFSNDPVSAGIKAIRAGKNIFTDTKMARSGIRKKSIEAFGGRVFCRINDPDVVARAKKQSVTRARMAVDMSANELEGGIYVVGNAPTALLRLIELLVEGKIQPALIIGLPVGFVNASESKALLAQQNISFITNKGRKGGSNIAAGVVNALIILANEKGKSNES
jgi:precorrin-8X/cobalt-precorrin-8 methylmutase